MKTGMIDANRIQSMIAQLRAAANRPQDEVGPADGIKELAGGLKAEKAAPKADFADALKASLDQVNNLQQTSQDMSKKFTLGDDTVNLSDVMISMQKASIAFQGTVQVRNKLVSAYHDMMNMQV
jgi:flagellar hook-basal body complex protein FliE